MKAHWTGGDACSTLIAGASKTCNLRCDDAREGLSVQDIYGYRLGKGRACEQAFVTTDAGTNLLSDLGACFVQDDGFGFESLKHGIPRSSDTDRDKPCPYDFGAFPVAYCQRLPVIVFFVTGG